MHVNGYLDTINKWKHCPMANYVCPVARYTKLETNTPRGLAFIYSLIVDNLKDIDEVTIERIYQCSLCRACEAISRDDSSIPEFILAARRDIVEMNIAPEPVIKLKDDICKNNKLCDTDRVKDLTSNIKSTPETVVVFNYESESSKRIFSIIRKLLTEKNIDCAEINIGKYPAPAAMLGELGYQDLSNNALDNLGYILKNVKFRKMVFINPYELELFLKNQTNSDRLQELVHSFEFLDEFIKDKVRRIDKRKEKVIYIDSEGNRKSDKFYEIPRKLLVDLAGFDIKEMVWNKKESFSCGGLTLKYLYRDIFDGIIKIISDELKDYNLKKVVTPCPHCIDNLYTNPDLRDNYEIIDLWGALFSINEHGD
jgi:Fe-S oxidoreductase